MNTAPIFDESLLGISTSKLNIAYWPTVMQTFEAKNYREAVLATLRYIDGSIFDKHSNPDQSEFVIPHGSIRLTITLKDNMFFVSAPFVRVPATGGLPLLRQVADINFNILVLTQIVMKNDELWFEYKCPIELCDPYKLYDIFREICNNADYYDDMFIEKFGAQRMVEVQATQWAEGDVEKGWQKYQEYLKEATDYLAYFESKRFFGFCWDTLAMTFMKIDYYCGTQGYIRTEIEKGIFDLGAQAQLPDLIAKAKLVLEKLKTFDRAKFASCMYKPNVFISSKTRSDIAAIQNNLRTFYDRAKNEMGSADHIGATLSLMYGIFNLYFRNEIPAEITKILNEGLKNASQKEWKLASEALWKAANTVMEMTNPTVSNQ
ncbi:hypothetical protein IT411_03175 [Candidatus Peregrinibacteria bacterium]|nr:hypothetical protein [Candidatus Peregrinibacteria bacterium]